MDLLARREHSCHELVTKLSRLFSQPKRPPARGVNKNSQNNQNNQNKEYLDNEPIDKEHLDKTRLDKDVLQAWLIQQVAILSKENLQSDERFIESFINGRQAQGKGPLRIRQELEQKRLSACLIAAYLDECDERWATLAEEVYLKKFKGTIANSQPEKAKRFRFMQYRGFSHEQIKSLI